MNQTSGAAGRRRLRAHYCRPDERSRLSKAVVRGRDGKWLGRVETGGRSLAQEVSAREIINGQQDTLKVVPSDQW